MGCIPVIAFMGSDPVKPNEDFHILFIVNNFGGLPYKLKWDTVLVFVLAQDHVIVQLYFGRCSVLDDKWLLWQRLQKWFLIFYKTLTAASPELLEHGHVVPFKKHRNPFVQLVYAMELFVAQFGIDPKIGQVDVVFNSGLVLVME